MMIVFGGVIGVGLFVGFGVIIVMVGFVVILLYLIGGVIVMLVMFMFGEMVFCNFDSGLFFMYVSSYFGEWVGFVVGWLYWFKLMMMIIVEVILFGVIFYDFLLWLLIWGGVLFMFVMLIVSNVYLVCLFGEVEYWLLFVKVVMIIVFMVFGVLILFGF